MSRNTEVNLQIPFKYKTVEGYSLGTWLHTQRKVYKGEQFGILGEDRIEKLERIGMIWESYKDLSWETKFNSAKTYFEKHNDLLVPIDFVDDSGVKLGTWISNIRTYRKVGSNSASITPERIRKLDSIGMVWGVFDSLWEQNYSAAVKYYNENGDLDVPVNYVTEDGIKLPNELLPMKEIFFDRTAQFKLREPSAF